MSMIKRLRIISKTLRTLIWGGVFLCIVTLGEENPPVNGLIIPGEKIYGQKWCADSSDLVSLFGCPDGNIELFDGRKMLIYGQQTLFFFLNDKLDKVSLGYNWLPFEVSTMLTKQRLDSENWYFSDILRKGSELRTVKTDILLRFCSYLVYYKRDKCVFFLKNVATNILLIFYLLCLIYLLSDVYYAQN